MQISPKNVCSINGNTKRTIRSTGPSHNRQTVQEIDSRIFDFQGHSIPQRAWYYFRATREYTEIYGEGAEGSDRVLSQYPYKVREKHRTGSKVGFELRWEASMARSREGGTEYSGRNKILDWFILTIKCTCYAQWVRSQPKQRRPKRDLFL